MRSPNTNVCLVLMVLAMNFMSLESIAQRLKYNFNHDWKLKVGDFNEAIKADFDDSDWEGITLPHAWNEDEAFKNDIKNLSTGIAWYRKEFKLPHQSDKKVFVEFEGVRQAGEVYVNGHYIGLHENGVMAFGYDITEFVKFDNQTNVIAVRTNNDWEYKEKLSGVGFQWSDKNFNANYGGIPKNVVLHVTNSVYQTLPLYTSLKTTGQYIYATDIDIKKKSAKVTAETQVKNDSKKAVELQYEVVVEDLNGKTVKTMDGGKFKLAPGETQVLSTSAVINDLNFWSWGYGYLYRVHTILKNKGKVVDKVATRTGFRKTGFSDGMIKLNDRVIMVKGYAQRTSNEWPAVGMSVPPWLSDYSNKLMVESNANLVRWMHVTPWKQDVESCDRVGLIQAMPAGDSERDASGRKWEQRLELMRDAIIYNRNNPSIIFYECGNEEISDEHMSEMKVIRDEYDPYGGRAIGSREMLDSEVAEYGGEMLYINKSDSKPVWAMEYSRDEGLRKYWDEYSPPYHKDGDGGTDYTNVNGSKVKNAQPYNRNQDSHAIENVQRWFDYWRARPGTGKRVSSGGVNIIFSDTNTHYRGAENYRRSGEVDPMRIPKDGFFAHQVMWDGWVDVENHRTHLLGHWNYKKDVTKSIYVVSSGEKVELMINDQSLGFGERKHRFLFTFDSITWEPGEIKAISYDSEGNMLSSDSKKTAGEPAAIKLTLMEAPEGMLANGTDLALIQAEVVDKDGNRCPTAMNILEFELEGPGEWRGGIAKGPDNYILSRKLPVECGVNRVLVRSLTTPGEIKLTATSSGLKGSFVSTKTRSVEVEKGLSLAFPAEELPVNLDRGPTPQTPSYSIVRQSVAIVGATAGSNQEDAEFCFDGRQSTRWENDGTLENGWIEFQLAEKTQIDQIAIKLSGWRTRSYPIVVTANDAILYQGITEPNLGFFYIKPEALETDKFKVRLFGPSEFNEEYQLVEITGKLDKETANDKAVKNASMLNIAEIEVFKSAELP